jgi:glycerol transport system ATP-binding protein
VGYFIGSPGMNVFPVSVAGNAVSIGNAEIELGYAPAVGKAHKVELGIRPEFIDIARAGLPVSIRKVEDIGRLKIVRASLADKPLTIVMKEDAEIPAHPHVTFRPEGIHIYADSWRVGREA